MQDACLPYAHHSRAPSLVVLQYDVEQFYIRGGYLLPKFHELYWIGYATLRGQHPEFSWTDGSAKTKYRHCEHISSMESLPQSSTAIGPIRATDP